MQHPLDGARLKVVRAQEQLQSFKDEVSRYLDRNPYVFPVEDHGDAVMARAAVIKEEPPLLLGCIFGECLGSLRESLDYISWELATSTKRFLGSWRLTWRCYGVSYSLVRRPGGTPMTATTDAFSAWLTDAHISEQRLTPEQRGGLQAAFHFRQDRGDDYFSTRLLSHFLLHCGLRLKVAQIARLLHLSRPTASRQQGLSSKEAVQQARHRLDGRPYGKLLPRYAGPIAEFLCRHPEAPRADLIDYIDHTFGVRVSRIAVYKFLKKYGLDCVGAATPATVPARPRLSTPPPGVLQSLPAAPPATPLAPPFCSDARSTRGPS
jgi:hypothetical protein